jgi:hypothetical protein
MTDPEPTRIALALVILLVGGVALNWWVETTERKGKTHFSWVFVVIGVSGTLSISTLLVPFQWVLWVVGCFAASGAPMVVGAMLRHERKVDAEKAQAELDRIELEKKLLELIRADQTTTPG